MNTHRQIFEEFKDKEGFCVTCGQTLPEDDSLWDAGHVLNPRAQSDETWSQCCECNAKQGNQTLDEWDVNGDVGIINKDPLRTLIDLRDTMLKQKIRLGNRQLASKRTDTADQMTDKYYAEMCNLVKNIDNDIRKYVETLRTEKSILLHAMEIRGVGAIMAAQLVSQIDINRTPSISALWKYAGYAPGFDKCKEGERRPYNARLRTICYKIASQMLKAKSPYRVIYDKRKGVMEVKHPEYTKGHRHNDALRIMLKIFLSHLWVKWRELEGLSVSKPYVHEVLEHTDYYEPEEFGWAQKGEEPKGKLLNNVEVVDPTKESIPGVSEAKCE